MNVDLSYIWHICLFFHHVARRVQYIIDALIALRASQEVDMSHTILVAK